MISQDGIYQEICIILAQKCLQRILHWLLSGHQLHERNIKWNIIIKKIEHIRELQQVERLEHEQLSSL
jgi:hypothetical protein